MKSLAISLTTACALGLTAVVHADLRYEPRNPSFGGNASNGHQMLESARAQDSTDGPAGTLRQPRSPADQIRRQLERAVVSELTMALRNEQTFVDDDGNLVGGGSFETGEFSIRVSEDGERITIEDFLTGEQTIIQ